MHVGPEVGAALISLCEIERVSVQCGLLTAWIVLMLRLSGQQQVVVGQPYSVQPQHWAPPSPPPSLKSPISTTMTWPAPAPGGTVIATS